MKILVTGNGTSGSWQIRGVQLGGQLGASVQGARPAVDGHDLAIVVKRAHPEALRILHAAALPLVWDVVDAWPQPAGNHWGAVECKAWLAEQIERLRPAAVVAATQHMRLDIADIAPGLPVVCVPHHARPGLWRNPVRATVKRVGYEGGNYLGHWEPLLRDQCRRRGWSFEVNPRDGIVSLDIVVAMREAKGYAARCWKSNVKLANAQGSGTPVICERAAAYYEAASPAGEERYADTPAELSAALDELEPHAVRRQAADGLHAAAPQLWAVAAAYRTWLAAQHAAARSATPC